MLKKIDKSALKIGMFVEDFVGQWDSNSPVRRRFMITSPSELAHLRSSPAITAVIINSARGEDAMASETASSSPAPAEPASLDKRECLIKIGSSSKALATLFEGLAAERSVDLAKVNSIASDVQDMMEKEPLALIGATRIKSKDQVTFQHSIAVSALMMHLAAHLGYSNGKVRLMGVAGLLHDIGKTRIPDEVLNKSGKLSQEELQIIRDHPKLGYEILKDDPHVPDVVKDICLHHHEKLDGTGYPDGLSGSEISEYVRLSTICDVYDAVTSHRPYKKRWTHRDAVEFMLLEKSAFDRNMLHAFFDSLEALG